MSNEIVRQAFIALTGLMGDADTKAEVEVKEAEISTPLIPVVEKDPTAAHGPEGPGRELKAQSR